MSNGAPVAKMAMPKREILGTLCDAVFCGEMEKPRLDGATTFCGS
jgi:hypothetical protein